MTGVVQDSDEEEGSALPNLADLLRLLRNRARIISAGILIGLAGSVGLVLVLPPQFVATATILIDPREKQIADMKSVTSELVANTPVMESEVEIIRSRDVVTRVIQDLDLVNDAELHEMSFPWSTLRWIKRSVLQVPPAEADTVIPSGQIADDLIDRFNDRVVAGRVGESYLINVSFRSKSAQRSVAIADKIAEAYVQQQIDAKGKTAKQATAWLDARIGELRLQVSAAERAVDQYKTENGLIDSEGQLLDEKEASRHMEQLVQARNATAEARAKLQRIEAAATTPDGAASIGAVLQEHTISLLKDQLGQASRSAAELETKYGPRHPSLIRARAQVTDLREQLAHEVERIITNERSNYAVAVQREQDLGAGLETIKTQIGKSSAAVVRMRELEREAKASRDVYENFLKRAEEVQQQQDVQLADARIVDRAALPAFPTSPKRLVILLAGIFGGLLAGLTGAVAMEFRSPSFVRSEAIESGLKIRYLTSVSRFTDGGDPALAPELRQMRRILSEPHSPFAECVRSIRVAIERNRRRPGPQIVLIASALPGEGKTMLASNLALHYALSGMRTVLVDCDLRQAGLTRELLPMSELSLHDCIMERLPVRQAVVREMLTGLNFLPAIGEATPAISAAELLASPPLSAALTALKYDFDIIVLDSPPVIPVVDASILADLADQVIFVTRWKATSQSVARRAIGKLAGNAHKLTGVVVNHVPHEQLGALQVMETGDYATSRRPGSAVPSAR
jgi:polysaccharide biosynthesis transport protein